MISTCVSLSAALVCKGKTEFFKICSFLKMDMRPVNNHVLEYRLNLIYHEYVKVRVVACRKVA